MRCINPTPHGHTACGSQCPHECKICEEKHEHVYECIYCRDQLIVKTRLQNPI